MTSRYTVDTTSLRVRDIFAFHPKSGDIIQPGSIPVIGMSGHIDWKSSLEFLSTISVPTLSTSILGILTAVQPGLSSLSTLYFSTMTASIGSTIDGLGSLRNGNDYISSSKLSYKLAHLAGDYTYISSTRLYDCIGRLGNLNTIDDMFDARGYVSTVNPGEYRIYQSSLGLAEGQPINTPIGTEVVVGARIDIRGYTNHIVNSSKMRIDVNTNLTMTFPTSAQRTLSTFLTLIGTTPIADPVVVTYSGTSAYLPNVSFIINNPPLTTATYLTLNFITDSVTVGTLNTMIPKVGGIHVMLDNTD